LYAAAGRLQAAGVKFCFRSNDGPYSRNVPFEAAISVAYGLDEEAAQRAVTLSAAEILGMGKELGSISIGKRANLVIADGSPLQASTQLKGVIIDGVPQSLETRQTR
jgi:imidazolonepropionase-like amidohydrolase